MLSPRDRSISQADHADCPMPEAVDWFIFPEGIAPIVQPTAAQVCAAWEAARVVG